MEGLEQKVWWNYLGGDLQKLLTTSRFLIGVVEGWRNQSPDTVFDDYAFVVFPAAKAYEGFLKKVFLELKFITEEDYFGKHFRIGKSLNPSLPPQFRNGSVYGKLVSFCRGKDLADYLWETWRVCRNLTFHWFPNEKNDISFSESIDRVNMIITAIDKTFEDCKINR